MEELFTQAEYARFRRCSTKTLERERVAGTGCPYIRVGGRVLYRRGDIEAFLAARVRRSTSEPAVAA